MRNASPVPVIVIFTALMLCFLYSESLLVTALGTLMLLILPNPVNPVKKLGLETTLYIFIIALTAALTLSRASQISNGNAQISEKYITFTLRQDSRLSRTGSNSYLAVFDGKPVYIYSFNSPRAFWQQKVRVTRSALKRLGESGRIFYIRKAYRNAKILPAAPLMELRAHVLTSILKKESTLPSQFNFLSYLLPGTATRINAFYQGPFQKSGLLPLIALSGFHLAMISMLFLFIFSRILRPRSALACAAGLSLIYTLLAGPKVSLLRALISQLLALITFSAHKKIHPFKALSTCVLIALLLRPEAYKEIGFQLSFLAVLGILCGQALSPRAFLVKRWEKILASTVSMITISLSAFTATAPLLLADFGRVSLASWLLMTPLSLVLIPHFLCGVFLLIMPAHAWPFLTFPARWVFSYSGRVLHYAILQGASFPALSLRSPVMKIFGSAVIVALWSSMLLALRLLSVAHKRKNSSVSNISSAAATREV